MKLSLFSTVRKFASLAEEAGLSLDTVIQFLDAGVTMETLVRLFAVRARQTDGLSVNISLRR